MRIPFVTRSRFLQLIEDQVVSGRISGLGWPLEVRLDEGGYPGRISVEIDPEHADDFEAAWERSDPTRFPQRIRAAATWLRNHGHFGTFVIGHAHDGSLMIAHDEDGNP